MNESAKVIDIQDQLIIKEFGIEEITAANIALMEKQILEIPERPETKAQYDDARRFNVDAKKLIPRIEERRKELKAPILEKGKAIDDTAKKAVAMVQPLIELSGTRRQAGEDIKAAEKAEKERIEAERLEKINSSMEGLKVFANQGLTYNRASEDIANDLTILENFEISDSDFMEHTEEAKQIKATGIIATKTALENRKKFEADQAEAARVRAEQEAEAARLAEEREKLEMERKSQELAALEAAEAEAERIRLKEDAIQAEREALEAEKAKIAREAVWDEAHQENFNRDHEAAIIENEQRKADAQAAKADFEECHAAALIEHKEFRKRQQLIALDKMMLSAIATDLNQILEDYEIPKINTEKANAMVLDLITSIKTVIYGFERRVEKIR